MENSESAAAAARLRAEVATLSEHAPGGDLVATLSEHAPGGDLVATLSEQAPGGDLVATLSEQAHGGDLVSLFEGYKDPQEGAQLFGACCHSVVCVITDFWSVTMCVNALMYY